MGGHYKFLYMHCLNRKMLSKAQRSMHFSSITSTKLSDDGESSVFVMEAMDEESEASAMVIFATFL